MRDAGAALTKSALKFDSGMESTEGLAEIKRYLSRYQCPPRLLVLPWNNRREHQGKGDQVKLFEVTRKISSN